MTAGSHGRLIAVEIDPSSLRPVRSFIDEERAVAVHDLIADNTFEPAVHAGGDAYRLRLSVADGKLVLDIAAEDETPVARHILSLTPLRRVVKDYFMVCEAYYRAAGDPSVHIEAIDVGRRGLHNEGAEILRDRLSGRVAVDFPTARRLFTLVCALYWKG